MPRRVIIATDGQNLYHQLRNIGYREADIDWKLFLNSLLAPDDTLIRTYWFRPQKLQEIYLNKSGVARQIIDEDLEKGTITQSTHQQLMANIKNLPPNLYSRVEKRHKTCRRWLSKEKQQFSQVDRKYSVIENEYDDLEIYRTGVLKVNPYTQERIGEKGVDVALSVKMVEFALTGKCDKIILVSGDLDYYEAIKTVKNNMVKVHIVKFHKGHPPKNTGTSKQLSQIADKVLNIYEKDLQNVRNKK